MKTIIGALGIYLFAVAAFNAGAQTAQEQAEQELEQVQNSTIPLESYIKSETAFNTPNGLDSEKTNLEIKPFGASLFDSGPLTRQRNIINPEYLIAPGDKVSIQLWGAVDYANVHIVDNQGNIFIPNVGPVKVLGLQAEALNQTVTERIKRIYTDNVNIYVNLLASTPVGVFVTGNVERPGQYAGASSDTVLYYLQQAGGILSERGSYRKIDIIRNDSVVLSVDLYDFLNEGRLASQSFKDGDVILVHAKGPSIVAEGIEEFPTRYELSETAVSGNSIIQLLRPNVDLTHVAITGVREQQPISRYLALDAFANFIVKDGDNLLFNDDLRAQEISVRLNGSYLGPSFYAIDNSTRLHDLLATVPVDKGQADIQSVYILRESVKREQQRLLNDSLERLERNVFTAPASSDGEARLRAQEAQLVSQFIDRARQIEPLGKVVVSVDGKVSNIRLEQGDEIVIPQKSDLINVAGEVMLPQAIVHGEGMTIADYVSLAGGFTDRANTDTVLLVHANGATTLVDNGSPWFNSDAKTALQPGDQILILPKVDSKLMQTAKDLTQILFQIAVAANVAFD